jgi:hypothetical protein
VLQGLSIGDRVVRAGHQKLYDGARVMPVPGGGMSAGPGGPGAAKAAAGGGGR